MTKWVYSFGDGKAEGEASMRNLLGGKGANLAEMASIGLPVPPGFTITTEVCRHVMEHGPGAYPSELDGEVKRVGGKLSNAGFVDKAPAEVIDKERAKLAEAEQAKAKLQEQRDRIATL